MLPVAWWYINQLTPASKHLTITIFGTAFKPWPIVPLAPVPTHFTILNPAAWFADTVDVIEPSEFDEPAPLAFQFQATPVAPEAFASSPASNVKPSALKAVKAEGEGLSWALLLSVLILALVPLCKSKRLWA